MEQFTANEVVTKLRERFASGNDVPVPDVRLTRAEFDAFADLLEAREKAVPVGYISADDIRELDVNREDDAECADAIEMLIASRPFASNHTAIYTHPAPSDAERLAEPYYIGWCRYKTHDGRATTLHLCDSDDEGAFRIYRHAHSAQAQPPADAEPEAWQYFWRGHWYTTGSDEPWRSKGMSVRALVPSTQPPAASVPDKRAASDYECTETFNGPDPYSSGHRDGWNACREAMLAAQENPND